MGSGVVLVYYGADTTPTLGWWNYGTLQDYAYFGTSVATAGDVNGDGFAEIIVGAPEFNGAFTTNEGKVCVFYGGSLTGGPSVRPQQRRFDDAVPIAQLGESDSPNAFRLAALGRSPFGRGEVKLEWEVKPLGTPTGQSANWIDTDTAGVALNELVTGLSPNTVYHWRVRLLYKLTQSPFQQYSRWFTMPWNGWEEVDLRTP